MPKDQLPTPMKTPLPSSTDVNSEKTLIGDLTPVEREELRVLRDERKEENREYERKCLALESLSNLIHDTVSPSYHIYVHDKETVYDILTALKQRIAPTDRAREIEYISQYQKLKKGPQNQNVEEWIKLWETTYNSCKKMKIPDVADTRPVQDFLSAVYDMVLGFTGYWRAKI